MTEETLFSLALEKQSPEERAAFLDQACAGQPQLRAAVEALLQAHAGAGSFLDKPPVGAAGATADEPAGRWIASPAELGSGPGAEVPGTRVGPYKLLQKLGEGGMGAVYMAEQEQPVRRRVALKIIKSGLDSAYVIARFEAERQALALMDHPHIAKVLDAGTTTSGRPYFVMELVKGIPLTRFCDQERLTPKERLALFIPVCQAVQHAHTKGIIHRDLKPSNVLIALYDGKPVPKVIDFGVAKATAQKLTERTMFTEVGQIVGTLEYMAPEQAELNNLDIDTRADIYSLGVLLYELLTGGPPFTAKQLRSAAFTEMLRMIREVEPPKPSTKLSSSEELPSIAAKRKLEPAKLTRLVQGDLDWIVMKALEKDRGRRYETANGFAMDIQRYLADEPVAAGPPSVGYRLRKFARRNRKSVLTALVILLALVAGVVGTTIGLVRALAAEKLAGERLQRAEEAEAEAMGRRKAAVAAEAKALQEAAIARAVSSFLQQDLLEMADSETQLSAGLGPDPDIKLRTLLERAESRVKERFADQPEVETAVRNTLGKAFGGVGDYARSAEQFDKVLAYREAHLGPEHLVTLVCMLDLCDVLGGTERRNEAVPLSEAAYLRTKTKLGNDDPLTLRAMHQLGGSHGNVGHHKESLKLFEEVYRLRKEKLGPNHPETLESQLCLALCKLGSTEATLLLEDVHQRRKTLFGSNHPGILPAKYWLIMQYSRTDRVDEANTLSDQNLKLSKAVRN
jgi:serine/threonine protein kinase